ncbi:YqkE family protein [Halobacillus sp. B23F22_1]|uniref:YqkE family protein n=1 Tax=Halobacillus sp. B23F22_1 TaxID=3459514 RepID=UPI00373FA230
MNNKSKGSLANQLNEDLLKQLQEKKSTLKQQEKEREEIERQKKAKERKKREANKSFEELLNESELDWKKYKR